MPDDRNERGLPERGRINISESHEVTYWTHRFDVTPEQLTHAIANIGPMIKDVARYLHKPL